MSAVTVREHVIDETDEAAIRRLAQLTKPEYDRCRVAEAKTLGIRPGTLDDEVEKLRKTGAEPGGGTALDFKDVEPWPESVDGAAVLDEAAATFARYAVLPKAADHVLALWAAHAHCFEAFTHTPRLNITAPEKGCGKTLLLDVLHTLTPRALRAENVTTAVLFRLIDKHKPTLLMDEYDSYLKDNEELRGALNAGHKRGGQHLRCEGDQNEVRAFRTFGPVALAGIRGLPGTLHDRSIVVTMTRAKAGEVRQQFDSRRTDAEATLNRQLARWAADHFDQLEACDPALPDCLYNRQADNWRPLAAIADVAGGAWPERLRQAVAALRDPDDAGDSTTVMLLADIRCYFDAHDRDRVPSQDLADWLATLEDRPWPEWRHGKPITVRQISRLLAGFKIKPKVIRYGDLTPRGYEIDAFAEAFARYLPDSSATPQQPSNDAACGEFRSATLGKHVAEGKRRKPSNNADCCGVADQNPWGAEL